MICKIVRHLHLYINTPTSTNVLNSMIFNAIQLRKPFDILLIPFEFFPYPLGLLA
jgi:hypothetical protein